uniref:arginyltransferase n=1 Tax=Gongylonema pulchrum TaxID=637853 RepID=A0A183E347_9BILA
LIATTCCPQYTIRLDVQRFYLSRSQKRVLRRMNDFLLKDIRPKERPEKTEDAIKKKDLLTDDTQCTRRGFTDFLTDSPLFSDEGSAENKSVALGTYHQQYYLDGQLIAVGVVDILPRCLSSKYLFHDPQYKFLMLGTYTALSGCFMFAEEFVSQTSNRAFSIFFLINHKFCPQIFVHFREIAFVRELMKERPELHYYYMGYYIHSCAKMRYKGRFHPSDLSVILYGNLLKKRGFTEKETYMDDYAHIVGPLAQDILLYRVPK